MKLELFSDAKWEILSELGKTPQSPSELSKKFGTTISNITQQLKLLEYSGLVGKKKGISIGPGKKKTIYRIKDDKTFVISLSSNGVKKKELKKNPRQSVMTNIWLYAKEEDKYFIEKFFWENEFLLDSNQILLKKRGDKKITVVVVGAKLKTLKTNITNGTESKDFEVLQNIDEPKDYYVLWGANNE